MSLTSVSAPPSHWQGARSAKRSASSPAAPSWEAGGADGEVGEPPSPKVQKLTDPKELAALSAIGCVVRALRDLRDSQLNLTSLPLGVRRSGPASPTSVQWDATLTSALGSLEAATSLVQEARAYISLATSTVDP